MERFAFIMHCSWLAVCYCMRLRFYELQQVAVVEANVGLAALSVAIALESLTLLAMASAFFQCY